MSENKIFNTNGNIKTLFGGLCPHAKFQVISFNNFKDIHDNI